MRNFRLLDDFNSSTRSSEDFEIGKCRACKRISPLNEGFCENCIQSVYEDEDEDGDGE